MGGLGTAVYESRGSCSWDPPGLEGNTQPSDDGTSRPSTDEDRSTDGTKPDCPEGGHRGENGGNGGSGSDGGSDATPSQAPATTPET